MNTDQNDEIRADLSDVELISALCAKLGTLAAVGADALMEAEQGGPLVAWLTEAGTGFSQAAVARPVFDGLVLTEGGRAALKRALTL
jgi:hypothetical protein